MEADKLERNVQSLGLGVASKVVNVVSNLADTLDTTEADIEASIQHLNDSFSDRDAVYREILGHAPDEFDGAVDGLGEIERIMTFAEQLDKELEEIGAITLEESDPILDSPYKRRHADSLHEDDQNANTATPSFVPANSVNELMDEIREFEKQYTPQSANAISPLKSDFGSDGAAHVLSSMGSSLRRKLWEEDAETMVGIGGHEISPAGVTAEEVVTTNVAQSKEPSAAPLLSIITEAEKMAASATDVLPSSQLEGFEESHVDFVPLVPEYSETGGAAWEEAVKIAAKSQEKTVRENATMARTQDSTQSEAAKAASKIEDERIHGDFSHWHTGSRLSVDGIKNTYVGLYETAQDAGSHYSVRVLECVVRPDVALADLIGAIVRVAKTGILKCSIAQKSHAILAPFSSASASADNSSILQTGIDDADSEWDIIDAQVCVSKELKQRVVLIQFLKRLNPFSNISPTLPLNKCPRTLQIMKYCKRALSTSNLCLSCLYRSSVTDVCLSGGLDTHFKVQLYEMYRDTMWSTLKEHVLLMHEQVKEAEQDCSLFMTTMLPLYKQHEISMPDPFPRKKLGDFTLDIGDNQSRAAFIVDSDSLIDEDITSPSSLRSPRASIGTPETSSSAEEKIKQNVDGMTLCLLHLHAANTRLQASCDEELAARLEHRKQYTRSLKADMALYKRTILEVLANSVDAERSQFNRSITVAFEGVLPYVLTFSSKPSASSGNLTRTASASEVGWGGYLMGFISSAAKADEPVEQESPHDKDEGADDDITKGGSDEEGDEDAVLSGLDAFDQENNVLGSLERPPVVLYYCLCMVGNLPGNLYVTQQHLWLVFGLSIPGIPLRRESYPLANLDSISQPENGSLLTANSSKFSFYSGEKIITISPLAVDRTVLKMVIIAIRDCFHGKSRIRRSKAKAPTTPSNRRLSKSRSRNAAEFKRANSLRDL